MRSLTELEQHALAAPINLADGHPRQEPTEGQRRIIARLPELFESAESEPLERLERRAQRAFLDAVGQHSAPLADGRVFSLYSSSVATMVLATCLRRRAARVALVHPTFDNLPDLLSGSVELVPIAEQALAEADVAGLGRHRETCVFVTTPNNPTGWWLSREGLERLACACAERGFLLCLDTSFRGFDLRTQFDSYEVLHRTGVDYVVIEDTGKLWPVSELKLGFVAVSRTMRDEFAHALRDVLLSVSPFVLRLVEELAIEAAQGGFGLLHDLIATNRAAALAATEELEDVYLPDRDARISVCRVRFRSAQEADRVRRELSAVGVHVLPGRQFHWADPEQGGVDLRLAVARRSELVGEALGRLRMVVDAGSRTPVDGGRVSAAARREWLS